MSDRMYLKIEPSGFMELKGIDPERDMLDLIHHELDGGFFEIVHCHTLPRSMLMLVDDCGMIKNLPFNPIAQLLYGHPIAGTVLIMREDYEDGEPDIYGLTADDVYDLIHKLRGLIVIREVDDDVF